MAKRTAEEKEEKKLLSSVFDGMEELNPHGTILANSALSIVDDWIDTGSYALNAIVSGSCFKGIQNGRVIGFTGPSGCGKTLMSTKIVGNHQKKGPDRWGIIFDSEIAVDEQTALNLGADPSRIRHYPVNTVNGVRNQVTKLLNNIIEMKMQNKFVIVIDSLGMLAGTKEIADIEKDKDATDMGLRAKELRGMLRAITWPAAIAKTPVIFTNHTYKNPMEMYPSAVDNQSGGEGPIYAASLLIQLGFKREKNEKDYENEEIIAVAKKVGGITMHALTVKNRFIPQMLTTDLYLNFKTGLDRYSGLFDIAKALNVIEGNMKYTCKGLNLGYRKDFERDPKAWDEVILPVLEPVINKEFSYHSEADALKKEVEELSKITNESEGK